MLFPRLTAVVPESFFTLWAFSGSIWTLLSCILHRWPHRAVKHLKLMYMFVYTYILLKNLKCTCLKCLRHWMWSASCQSRISCGKNPGKIFGFFGLTAYIWKLFEKLLHYITRQMTPHFVPYTKCYRFQVFSAHIHTFSEIQRPWNLSLGKFAIRFLEKFSLLVFYFSFWHKPWGVIVSFLDSALN